MGNTFKIVKEDGYLSPYDVHINRRYERYNQEIKRIKKDYGSITNYANWHSEMGFTAEKNNIVYREWAPEANCLYLIGDFNNWNRSSHPLKKDENGVWEIKIPKKNIKIGSKVKVLVDTNIGQTDRIPAFIKTTYQNPYDYSFTGVLWIDQIANKEFKWDDKNFKPAKELYIYEAHVGMAIEEHRVGQFKEFADNILKYIKNSKYNCIQLMAVMEHPYYGSFGYHVSNIFAVSSRFGTPNNLKYLINKAHKMEIAIVIDLVHSHAIKNIDEGLNYFDGTDYQYFHSGPRGYHNLWDSLIYNYSKYEVQRYLLSNIKYWLEEFHIDGFRFDGITSMLYHHHGQYVDFVNYDMYFDQSVDEEALLYLQLATTVSHKVNPNSICIAEDMSGMPGLCRKIKDGGIGFDYRLGMGIPDLWIKYIKEKSDEEWNLETIFYELISRRKGEKTIAYSESHDQAIVGDKTIAFRLMDQDMYWNMSKDSNSQIIDRGIALHKMIRAITLFFGGEAYLNFIGNEFGHPEWIDFPREGNGFSYQHSRRQWSLIENENLRYKSLGNFDVDMLELVQKEKLMSAKYPSIINYDRNNQIITLQKGNLIFVFSFNVNTSFPNYEIGVPISGTYKLILSSDDTKYGGHGRIEPKGKYYSKLESRHSYNQHILIYITNRTLLVFKKPKKK